jgi:hypothetical protein
MHLCEKCFAYINPVFVAYTSDATAGYCDGKYVKIRPTSAYSLEAHNGNLFLMKDDGIPVIEYSRGYFKVLSGRYYCSPSGMHCVCLSVCSYTGIETTMILSENDILHIQYRMIPAYEFNNICDLFSDDRNREAYRLHLGNMMTTDYMSKSYDSAAREYNMEHNGGMYITDKTPNDITVALYADRPEMLP